MYPVRPCPVLNLFGATTTVSWGVHIQRLVKNMIDVNFAWRYYYITIMFLNNFSVCDVPGAKWPAVVVWKCNEMYAETTIKMGGGRRRVYLDYFLSYGRSHFFFIKTEPTMYLHNYITFSCNFIFVFKLFYRVTKQHNTFKHLKLIF